MNNCQTDCHREDRIEDLHYKHIDPKFRSVQIVYAVIIYALLMCLALFLLIFVSPWWCIAAEIVIVLSLITNLIILKKAYQFKGYALREHDITYRSGVIFPKTTTVPFNKIQQVSISRNPVTRYFGLYAIEIVNGAQNLSSLAIQGLTMQEAEHVKNTITLNCYD